MLVTINGERRELPEGATVATVLDLLAEDGSPALVSRGVAVALDNEVVPRGRWASTPVREGARVEVLAAIQGGSAPGTMAIWVRICDPDRHSFF